MAFNPRRTRQLLRRCIGEHGFPESVLLSTCNRTELYVAGADGTRFESWQLKNAVCNFANRHDLSIADQFYEYSGRRAIGHLFRVASGMESMVLGETEILGQVKQAYRLACETQTNLPIVHRLFQSTVRAARRIANETGLQSNRTSLASIAIGQCAMPLLDQVKHPSTLIIGAGTMARQTLQYVAGLEHRSITVINRTLAEAKQIAKQVDGNAAHWDELPRCMATADLVISATGSSDAIVNEEMLIETCGSRPLVILDLAVPRDFAPSIGAFPGVHLFTLDDIQQQCDQNYRSREECLPIAKRIVEEESTQVYELLRHRFGFGGKNLKTRPGLLAAAQVA